MIVKNPGPSHSRFRIMRRERGKYLNVASPQLDIINKDFKTGLLTPERARLLCDELKRALEKAELKPVSWLPENMQLAEAYLAAEVEPKENRQPASARNRITGAIKRLGATSLLASDVATLKKALSGLNVRQKRKYYGALNSILRWKGSLVRLSLPKEEWWEPEYMEFEEAIRVAHSFERRELQLVCLAAIGTGGRYGELFTITPQSLREQGTHVYIDKQWSRDRVSRELRLTPTKNGMKGTAFIPAMFREAVKEWAAVPPEVKLEIRQKELPGELFRIACEKLLGRPLTFHNLRHSYAHYMIAEQKATLEELKGMMRDRVSTLEKYYVSWVQTSAQMRENVKRWG